MHAVLHVGPPPTRPALERLRIPRGYGGLGAVQVNLRILALLIALTSCGGEAPARQVNALRTLPVIHESRPELDGPRTIALIFRPDDCPNILHVIERFNAADVEESGSLTLVGVIDTRYRRSALKVIRAYDVRFPVLFDSLGRVREEIGATYRPTLVRTREGFVETIATVSSEDRDEYFEIMRDLVSVPPPR